MTNLTRPESFTLPVEASRRGAHRARPNPVLGVLPMVAVVAVVLAVVWLAYTLFGNTVGGKDSAALAGAQASPAAGASASAGGAAPSAGTDGGASPAPSVSTDPGQAGSPSPATPGVVSKAAPLNFFNATQVQGLSRKAAAALAKDGWKQGVVEAWAGPAVTQTTVYYAKPTQRATAQAIVDALGVGVAKQSATLAKRGIAVVVFSDYTP